MAKFSHPRWSDDALQPERTSTQMGYSSQAKGDVAEADVLAKGKLVGYVWTDGKQAAGFVPSPGEAGAKAQSRIWRVHADAYQAGKPAKSVLDQALYGDEFTLHAD